MDAQEAHRGFHIMIKPRGPICNLACVYCYYLQTDRLYPSSTFRMSDELLKEFTRQYIQIQRTPKVTFAWQGGEPTLMGLEFFEQAIYYQQTYAPPGMRIQNTLQTNGMTLDDNWARFFKENDFLIGISLDGPRELHNAYRVDRAGRGSFDRVMEGLRFLHRHRVEFNVLTAVHSANEEFPLKVYHFLRDEARTKFIQFIPIVERISSKGNDEAILLTDHTVHPGKYGNFLIRIFEEWVRHDVGRVFIQIFDVTLGAWIGQPSGLCVFSPTCGSALALEHNGDLFSCDHYVDFNHLLGNILHEPLIRLVGSPFQKAFGRTKSESLPQCCTECEVGFVCHGGCPKNRFSTTTDGEPRLNYLCDGYKSFFNHVGPAMQFMANELQYKRPPANVMQWMKEKDTSMLPDDRRREPINRYSHEQLSERK